MNNFAEAGICRQRAPSFPIVIAAVPAAAPAFFVIAPRIGAEEYAERLQSSPKLAQDARQFLTGDMKKRRISEHAIEEFRRKMKLEKILLPDFAAAERTCELNEPWRAFQSDRFVAEFLKRFQIPAGTAAEIENLEWSGTRQVPQQSVTVLRHIMIACALPKTFRMLVIVA